MPAAAISAASSVIGGFAQAAAAKKAAQAQQQASQANIGFQNQVLGNVSNDVNPIIGGGNQAEGELAGLLGIGGDPAAAQRAFDTFRNSTNYNFLLNQGLQGQAFLNAPNYFSGATAKALGNYAQGMAGNALQGYEGLLMNQQGLGLQGSNIYANAGTNIAAQEAQARNLAAGAQGNAALARGQTINNALSGISNLASSSFSPSAFGGFNPTNPNPGVMSAGYAPVTGMQIEQNPSLASPIFFGG